MINYAIGNLWVIPFKAFFSGLINIPFSSLIKLLMEPMVPGKR